MSIKFSELIKLVETCGKAGVKKFVHETEDGLPIHIEFHEHQSIHIDQKCSTSNIAPESPIEVPESTSGLVMPIQISPDFERQEALRLLEEDFDQLAIEDPELYETLLAQEQLGDFGEAHAR